MKHTATHVYGIGPDELTQRIVTGLEKKLSSIEKVLNLEKPTKYISRKEVSQKLNVSYVTLDAWNKKGILKKRKIGNKVFYLNEEIEKLLESSIS